ncbi:MAG: hypothetical protein KDE14_03955, partial [Rhodobacteraceae bacterium]|nr:hypothetical protein [Paracoccaceae bacterium]
MKKSLIAGLGLIVVAAAALGAVLAGDPARFRPLIESELTRLAGRPVSVDGSIEISLVPGLAVVARDITVTPETADDFALAVGQARVVLAWRNLLQGSAVASEVQLVEPRLSLGTQSAADLLARLVPAPAETPDVDQSNRQAKATRLRVEDGRLTAAATPAMPAITVDHIQLDLTADNTTRRKLVATFVTSGLQTEIEVSLRAGRSTNAIAVDSRFSIPEADLTGTATADLSLATDAPLGIASYAGRASISAGHLTDALALVDRLPAGDAIPPAFTLPMTATADVSGDAGSVNLKNVTIELGGQTAKGEIDIAIEGKSFDIDMDVTALVADTWILAAPSKSTTAGSMAAQTRAAGPAPSNRAWRGKLSVSAPLFTAGGQTARDGIVEAQLSDGTWTIGRAEATLPGQTKTELAGFVRIDAGSGAIDGSWTLSALDPRGFLNWIGIDTARVRTDRLSVLDANGTIQGTMRDVAFGDVNIRLDNATFTGRIGLGSGTRPNYRFELTADRFELDPYLPALIGPFAQSEQNQKKDQATDAGYGVTAAPSMLGALADFDADVRVEVGQLILGDVGAGTGAIDANLKSGRLNLRAFSLKDVGGLSLFATGIVDGLSTVPTLRGMQLDISAGEFTKVNRAWALDAAPQMEAYFPLSATLTGNGPQLGANMTLIGTAGAAEFRASGTAAVVENAPRAQFDATVSSVKPAAVLKAITGLDLKPDATSLTLNGKVTYEPDSIAWDGVKAVIGEQHATASGKIEHKSDAQSFSLSFEDVSADIDSLLADREPVAATTSKASHAQWSK